jgi:hypothetical protein
VRLSEKAAFFCVYSKYLFIYFLGENIGPNVFSLKFNMEKKVCLECEETIRGRSDKKFCSDACRTSYHNRNNIDKPEVIKFIDYQLKRNRKILKKFYSQFSENKMEIPVKQFTHMGFAFDFYTHKEILQSSEFVFCYEYGYNKIDENKVMLIKQSPFALGVELFA